MPDATTLERLDDALTRIEAAMVAMQGERARAERRFQLLDTASGEALAALDSLISREPG